MSKGSTPSSFVLPGDYRKTAEKLFPKEGFSKGQKPDLKSAAAFAKSLGIGVEYQRLLALEKDNRELQVFLEHFQNNLDLLIQKTWVEKSDENRKEKLQDEVPLLMASIEKNDFNKAIKEFGAILEELAYLFFGAQSTKDDFTEYTFRIDAQMGLFWWYGGRLSVLNGQDSAAAGGGGDKAWWAVLLIGLCYLTNF
jgi:hypothetical protein